MKVRPSKLRRFLPFVITADSSPIYDTWGWSPYWDCNDWITWHKSMVVKYGRPEANKRFLAASGDDNIGLFGHEKFCAYDPVFVKYFQDQGLGDQISALGTIIGNLAGGAVNVSQVAESGGAIGVNAANVIKYAFPILLTLAAAGIAYYGYARYLQKIKPA